MLRLSTQVVTVWLLRIMGFMICMAVGPIFFPRSWMEAIAVGLGLGEPPALPLFYYLARSCSAMYFAHGCFILLTSTNVIRYRSFVFLIAGLNLFLGSILLVIDWWAPMPWYWTCLEGPPILGV